MAHRLGLLHTAQQHVATFDRLLPDVDCTHVVRPAWLSTARRRGLRAVRRRVTEALTDLAAANESVVCTCTTLGPLVDELDDSRLWRVDAPAMSHAVESAGDGKICLVLCLDSTRAASETLLADAFAARGRVENYETHVCDDAWSHFENGAHERFAEDIARAVAEQVEAHGPATVVLGQASMAAAAPHIELPEGTSLVTIPEAAASHARTLLSLDGSEPGNE